MDDEPENRTATPEERANALDCLRCGTLVRRQGIWALRAAMPAMPPRDAAMPAMPPRPSAR